MAAYRRVYDSSHLQADCQEPGSAPEPYIRSAIEYGLPLPFYLYVLNHSVQQSTEHCERSATGEISRSPLMHIAMTPLTATLPLRSDFRSSHAPRTCAGLQYSINTKRELYATFLTPHFQEHQSIISAHFGIESVENLVAIRRNRFINRYGETDN